MRKWIVPPVTWRYGASSQSPQKPCPAATRTVGEGGDRREVTAAARRGGPHPPRRPSAGAARRVGRNSPAARAGGGVGKASPPGRPGRRRRPSRRRPRGPRPTETAPAPWRARDGAAVAREGGEQL